MPHATEYAAQSVASKESKKDSSKKESSKSDSIKKDSRRDSGKDSSTSDEKPNAVYIDAEGLLKLVGQLEQRIFSLEKDSIEKQNQIDSLQQETKQLRDKLSEIEISNLLNGSRLSIFVNPE